MRKTSLLLALFLVQCTADDPIGDANCPGKKFVKSIYSAVGIVQYYKETNQYAISAYIPGTIDAVDLGFVCSMPDSLKIVGQELRFDGNYFEYDQAPVATFAGTTTYYLALKKAIKQSSSPILHARASSSDAPTP